MYIYIYIFISFVSQVNAHCVRFCNLFYTFALSFDIRSLSFSLSLAHTHSRRKTKILLIAFVLSFRLISYAHISRLRNTYIIFFSRWNISAIRVSDNDMTSEICIIFLIILDRSHPSTRSSHYKFHPLLRHSFRSSFIIIFFLIYDYL